LTGQARIAVALGLGAAGGTVFAWLNLPLPWMLGALVCTMLGSVAGLPLLAPARIRPPVVAVIGVLLGSRFSLETMSGAAEWIGTLAILAVYCVIAALIVVPFYRVVGGLDRVTAYFAGMPGGLSEMIEIGEAIGARPVPIILAHSLRIVITIAVIAFWFRVVEGYAVGAGPAVPQVAISPADMFLLLATGVFGVLAGQKLHLPAPALLGPMIISGVLHLTAIVETAPPAPVVAVAQVVLGTILGCRFNGITVQTLVPALGLSLCATGLLLVLAAMGAQIMAVATQIDPVQALLALAPGGMSEMGLIALAVHADAAFVALHHVARILFVIVLAPLGVRCFR
jgi:membrane AbrB-like protein